MPPRREGFEPNLEAIQREVHRLFAEYGLRPRRNPSATASTDHEEEEDTVHRNTSSEEEHQPQRFGRTFYQRRTPDTTHRDYGVKVGMPAFDGGPDPDDFIDWFQEVERILEYKEVPADKQVKLVAIRLKKGASLWWENMKRARQREGKSKISTWEKM